MPCTVNSVGDGQGPFHIDYLKLYECDFRGSEWAFITLLLLWISTLIFLLGNTAENYLSPTLAMLCKKLKLSYNVAGITFLAFGNGAPDVFSLIASYTNSNVDSNIGIGALLGAGMFVSTVVVGSVCLVKPCTVKPLIYLRDVIFYQLAVLLIAIIVTIGSFNIYLSILLFATYASYVYLVVNNILPSVQSIELQPNTLENSGENSETRKVNMNSTQGAFWHPNGNTSNGNNTDLEMSNLPSLSSSSSSSKTSPRRSITPGLIVSTQVNRSKNGGYSFVLVDDTNDSDDNSDNYNSDENADDALEDGKLSFSGVIIDDYFNKKGNKSDLTANLLDKNSSSNNNSNSHENNSNSSTITSDDYNDRNMNDQRQTPRRPRRGTSLADSLKWHQYIIRRRLQRHITETEFWDYPLYSQIFIVMESPFTLIRDITVPTTDVTIWYKPYAILQCICAPQLLLIAFDVSSWENHDSAPLIVFFFSLLPALGIYLLTKNSSPPNSEIWSLFWTLCGFCMCITWSYMFAEELVTCLTVVGKIFSVSPGVLGLTVLAWGNSMGDFFANTAVAKQGRGELALAGCYAGPAFNMLFGLGISFFIVSINQYPKPYYIDFDHSSTLSVIFLFMNLLSTMFIVVMRNYQLDRWFGCYLIGLYILYTTFQLILWAVTK